MDRVPLKTLCPMLQAEPDCLKFQDIDNWDSSGIQRHWAELAPSTPPQPDWFASVVITVQCKGRNGFPS